MAAPTAKGSNIQCLHLRCKCLPVNVSYLCLPDHPWLLKPLCTWPWNAYWDYTGPQKHIIILGNASLLKDSNCAISSEAQYWGPPTLTLLHFWASFQCIANVFWTCNMHRLCYQAHTTKQVMSCLKGLKAIMLSQIKHTCEKHASNGTRTRTCKMHLHMMLAF